MPCDSGTSGGLGLNQIVVALIGAVGAMVVAWMNRPPHIAAPHPRGMRGSMVVKRRFKATKIFIFVVAPLCGAVVLSLLYRGAAVIAGSPSLKSPVLHSGLFLPFGLDGRWGEAWQVCGVE